MVGERLQIGDYVCRPGTARRLMVVDFNPPQTVIVVAWRPSISRPPIEAVLPRSGLAYVHRLK